MNDSDGSPSTGNGAPHDFSSPALLLESLQQLNFSHLLYFWSVARHGSIAAACDRLQLSQPTISMQIRKLEESLGHQLFERSGRNLALSEVGRTVYDYADEIFSIGRELLGTLRGVPGKRSGRLHVGIPTFLPNLIIYRLMEPVLHMPERVQLICHEAELSELVAGLSRHKFDVILTDTPVHSAASTRCFSHPLGECDVAICGVQALAAQYGGNFPDSLAGAPFLLPTSATDLRRKLDRWFDSLSFTPRVVGEFDDSALMKEFGGGGAGLFPMPSAVVREVERQYGVVALGRIPSVKVRYYAITTKRKLTHPATVVIAQTAKAGMLSEPSG